MEIEELLNQLDALAKRIDDMMRDVRDLTYKEFKLKEKIRLTIKAAAESPACAVCESEEIGGLSDGGDEIVTMCRDCGSIEQGYKK